MTTRWKKGLSLLLTVVMLMSMLPTTALAASVLITLSGGDLSTGETVTVSASGYTTTAQVQYSYLRGYHVYADIPSANNKTVTVETADGYSGSAPIISQGITNYSASVTLTASGSSSGSSDSKVYIYTLIPGVEVGSSTNADNVWNGMGIGTISGVGSATSYPVGKVLSTDSDTMTEDITFPENGFPDITANGETYRYAESGSGNEHTYGYYTIQWTQLLVANGANAGNNNYNQPIVSSNINTYHLDGVLILNETEYFTVTYLLQDAGASGFTNLADYAERVEKGTAESHLHFPSVSYEKRVNGVDYVFDGWYEDADFTTKTLQDGTITQNTTYYARYIPANFTVEYDLNGGTSDFDFADQEKVYDEALALYSEVPTRTNYTFTGWNTRVNGNGTSYAAGDTYSDNADLTLYAQWEPLPGTLVVEKTLWGLTQLPKDFYIEVIGENATYTLTADNMDPDSLSLFALDSITFTWTLEDVPAGTYDIEEYDYTAEGYNLDDSSVTYTAATIAPGGSAYAALNNIYLIQSFDVTYTDGIADEEIFADQTTTEEYGAPTPAFTGSTDRPGYKFLGWTPSVADKVTKTVTYTAVYAQLFNVTYTDGVDSEVIFADQVTEDIPAGDPTPDFNGDPDTMRPGYDFTGWQPEVSGKVTATVTYTAQWKPATNTKYTVEHYIQNADNTDWELKDTEPFTGTTGELVTADPITISGYVYDKTYDGNDPSGIIAANGSLVLKLYYRPVFTVTWMPDPVVDSRPLETDKNVMYGEAPSYDGTEPTRASDAQNDYTFAGWSTDSNADAEDAKAENQLPAVTKDVTYYAIFAADPHTFTGTVYVVLDGTANPDGTVNTGTLTNVEAITADDGDLFLSADGSTFYPLTRTAEGTYVHTALPVGDYQAYYEEDAHALVCRQYLSITKAYGDRSRGLFYNSVTYNLNGGNIAGNPADLVEYYHESTSVEVGTYAPVQEGYNFLGWKCNGTGDLLSSGDLLTASISQPYTLVAQWEKAVNVNVIIQLDHTDDAHPDAPDTSATADDVTFTLLRGAVDAAAPVTLTGDSHSGYTYTDADNHTTYESIGYAFTGLSTGDYTVYVAKPNYKVISRETTYNADKTQQTITVILEYVSDSFELDFEVKMKDGVPKSLWPHAVHVKVTQWNGSTWQTIAPLASASPIPVIIGADGTGSGFYTVDKTGVYRVEVLSYESASGNKISVSTTDQITYVSENNICYGTVSIEALNESTGKKPDSITAETAAQYGTYFDTVQKGLPTVTVDTQWGSLTFDPNGGTLNGSTDELTLNHLIRVPALTSYTPVRAGGYVFQGYDWYNDTNGNQTYDTGTDTPASALAANAPINSHYILVARWEEPITVEGNVYVQWDELDPITSVDLLLQRSTVSTADEHFTTVDPEVLNLSGITPITLNGVAYKVVPYSFSGLENVGTYRIRILVNDNFEITYQNESAGAAPGTDFTKYSATGNLAVLGDDNSAVINAHVKFDPHTVDLPFAIDATAIGTDFQPTEAEMKILYRGTSGAYEDYPSQPADLALTPDNLKDSYSFKVVPQTASTLYNFAMALQSETITANDGDDATTPLNNPYYGTVYQNWPAYYQSGRWSGTLTAVLTPKAYAITYDLTGGVWASGVTAPAQHTWSFATAIPTPVREGYLFMGWQAETAGTYANGSVPAPVHQDVKLTAVWEKDELNQNDPENNGGDGIPDKYQRKLTFQVVHGAWNDGTAADLVYVVTLKNASSENAVDGTASVTVPAVGDKPDYGYKAGAWDTDPGAAVAVNNTFPEGTSGKTYTYTYIAIGDQDVTYKEPDNPDSVQDPDNDPEDAHQPVPYGTYIKIVPNGGVWAGKTEPSYVKIEAPYAITDPTRTDYIFMGWLCEADGTTVYEDGIISYVFTAQWEQDVTGETGSGDTIPDCFQKSVIFAVKNGTWDGSDAADKSHVVTLTDANGQWSKTGSADISTLIPDVTAAQPNPGYQDPAWAPSLPAGGKVSGTAAETFTYTYVGNYILVQPNGGTWKGSADNACLLLLDDTLPLADPTREDHTFLVWQETADGVTVHADGIIRMVYTAQWIHDSQLVYPTTVTLRLDQVNTNVEDLHTGAQGIRLLANDGSGKTYDLIPGETGVYSEKVPAGTYYIHRVEGEHSHQIGDYLLTVNTHGGSRIIDHYSIGYDVNGGKWQTGDDPGVAIVFANTRQSTVSQTPVRDGYAFKGWKLGEKTYGSNVVFTDSITEKTVFTAVWEQLVDVKVNVTVNYARNDAIDNSLTRDEVTFQLLRDIGGAKDPVQPAKTITEASHAGYDVTSTTESIRYAAVENTYEDLPAGDYTVSVTKSGYRAQVTTTTSGNLQTIDVVLTFNPDNFDLYFDVVMADSIPQELWPDAVNVKATYWGDDGSGVIGWHVIDLAPVTVKLDASGKGSGHISVWKHLSGTANAYDYRVMVSGFVYNARAVVSATEIRPNEIYSDGNYTATVTVPGGRTSGNGLDGSYYGTSAQVGRPLVTVTVEQYDVTFDANGGTVNGKPADTVTDVYAIPAFSGFVPVRESYVFGGWYQDQACTIPAVEGKLLTENVTLYAKWSPIQSITGNVTVEGVYTHNGQLVEVHAIDRTTKINVALQVFDTVNGTLLGTVQNKQIGLTWPETPTGDGTGTYSFTDLQALPAGQRYRVLVYMTNYQSFYLNEDSVGNQFTEDANLAVFKTDPTATYVHADLIFAPDSYPQEVEVDATAIGEGFRPASAKAQILAWEQGTTLPYRIISQHDVAPYGLPITVDQAQGTGSATESVWKWNWTGKLYDYRAQLSELNGKPYTTDPRFSVSYSDAVCWNLHGNEAPGALTITLEPNTFDVLFDMNAPGMENMVKTDLHHWSHATDVSGILPSARSGYVFMGWYATPDHSGQPVTHIDPAVYTDTTLYAYWEADILEETPQAGVIGDGVPDIYQCVVTFEIVGGTWGQYGGSAPLQRVFTLWEKDASGIWTKLPSVTLGSRLPNNMWRNGSLDLNGHWNPAATVNTPVTGDATYTYTYRSAITATVVNGSFQMGSDPKTYVNTTHSIPHDYSTTEKCTVSFQPAKDHILLSATLTYRDSGNEITVDLSTSNSFGTFDAQTGTGSVTLPHDRDYNIHVVYTPDVLGPDGHPDIYQKKVNFVVKNGTWAGMNGASTITRYIPLYKDGKYAVDGTGTLDSIPTAAANQGYKLLGWDATPPATVSGINEVTYTFNCVPTSTALYDYDVEHWRQQPDSRYALESSEHKQVSVELNAQSTDFEPGKEPVITLSELEYKNYGIHYTPCDGLHYETDKTHAAPVLTVRPASILDRTLLKMYYCLNTYTLSYDLGEGVTGLIKPEDSSKLYGNGHKVSQAPARDGYAFLGWKDLSSGLLYASGAEMHLEKDAMLTAQWLPLEYTVNYLDAETGEPLQSPKVVSNVNLNDVIDVSGEIIETIITDDEDEYVFSHADKASLTITLDANNSNSANVINLYYEVDMWLDVEQDPSQSGGDGIPDKYQAVITYQVQGGKWADGTTADIKKVFTLYEKTPAGVWNKLDNVILGNTIPKAEVSDTHTGAWYPSITAATEVTGNATYVYSFTALPTYTVSYDLNKGTGASGVDYAPVTVVSGKTVTVKAAPSLRGYAFDGYTFGGKTYNPGDVITVTGDVVLTAQWDKIPDPVRPPASTTGSVVLTKCDAADHTTLLARVVFDLFTEDGDYVGTYTTNARGEIQVDNLRAGDYYWVETRPTEGYELDNREHSFTVSSGKTTEITVENARSEVPAVFSGDHYAYIIGYSDGMVHPQWKITRAEVATIFFRLLDEPTRSQFMTRSNSFSDVQPGMWFNTAVSTMASMGVINGYPNGTFQPNANITRAEFAAIAARFDAHGNTTGVSFSDIYEHWAYKEISIAANNGWILGYEDGTFKPNQHITRAEAMALVNRVLQRIPEHKSDLLHDMVQWPDNMDPTVWYFLTVQEATNSHDYGRKVSGYEYWINLREVPDWTALER